MKRNSKILKNTSDLKWRKFWVGGVLCFSEIGWEKSNKQFVVAATKYLRTTLQNPL